MTSNNQEVHRILLANVPALDAEFKRLEDEIKRLEEEKLANLEKIRRLENENTDFQKRCHEKETLLLRSKELETIITKLGENSDNNATQFEKFFETMRDSIRMEANLIKQSRKLCATSDAISEAQEDVGATSSRRSNETGRQLGLNNGLPHVDGGETQVPVRATNRVRTPGLSWNIANPFMGNPAGGDGTTPLPEDDTIVGESVRLALLKLFQVAEEKSGLSPVQNIGKNLGSRDFRPYRYLQVKQEVEGGRFSEISEVERRYGELRATQMLVTNIDDISKRITILDREIFSGMKEIKARFQGAKHLIVENSSKNIESLPEAGLDEEHTSTIDLRAPAVASDRKGFLHIPKASQSSELRPGKRVSSTSEAADECAKRRRK